MASSTSDPYAVANDPYLSRAPAAAQSAYGQPSQQQQQPAQQQQLYSYGSGGGGYAAGAYAQAQPQQAGYGAGGANPYGQQQQAAASISLIDQMPQQQPAYPYLQSSSTQASAPPQASAGVVGAYDRHACLPFLCISLGGVRAAVNDGGVSFLLSGLQHAGIDPTVCFSH
jgi:hypothetical protein